MRGLLAEEEGRVEVIDNLLTGYREEPGRGAGPIEFHRLDIRDYAAVAPVIAGADTVFHLAAIPSVPRSIREPVPRMK